jgi:hypothetical protein
LADLRRGRGAIVNSKTFVILFLVFLALMCGVALYTNLR